MTTSAVRPDTEVEPDGSAEPQSPLLVRVVASLPLIVPVLVTALSIAAIVCVLLGVFGLLTVLPLAVVLSLLGLWITGLGERHVPRKHLLVDVLAIGLALGFALFNAAYSSQNVTITRDPGIYGVTAQWLVGHDNLDLDGQPQLFGTSRDLKVDSAGIGTTKKVGHLFAQGAHVLPAFLAVSGRLFGSTIMFATNALIGGLALLAIYGFGRRIIGRWGALAAAGLIGVSLPQIAFSRDNYSEPLSQLLVFGGLALLWQVPRGAWLKWGLGGLVLAAGCMARIDAYLILPPMVAYAGLRLAATPRGDRTVVGRDVAAFSLGAAIPAVIGRIDLVRLAPGYIASLAPEFRKIMIVLVLSVIAAVLLVAGSWLGGRQVWERVGDRVAPVLGTVSAVVIVLVGLVLASRPLWLTVTGPPSSSRTGYMAILQAQEGHKIEPTRMYYENSVTWVAWYIGPLCAALALFGLALLVRRAFRERDLEMVPFLAILSTTAITYLVAASIVADQIWAMRRFVPVVLPGVAICGVLGASVLIGKLAERWRPFVAGATGLAFVLPVLYISQPFLTVREHVPSLREVYRVCATVPDDAGVIVAGYMSARYPMTVRAFCGVPAAGTATASLVLTPEVIKQAQAALAKDGRRLYIVSADDVTLLPRTKQAGPPTPVSEIQFKTWRETLTSPPRIAQPGSRWMFVGEVGPDGKVIAWQNLQK